MQQQCRQGPPVWPGADAGRYAHTEPGGGARVPGGSACSAHLPPSTVGKKPTCCGGGAGSGAGCSGLVSSSAARRSAMRICSSLSISGEHGLKVHLEHASHVRAPYGVFVLHVCGLHAHEHAGRRLKVGCPSTNKLCACIPTRCYIKTNPGCIHELHVCGCYQAAATTLHPPQVCTNDTLCLRRPPTPCTLALLTCQSTSTYRLASHQSVARTFDADAMPTRAAICTAAKSCRLQYLGLDGSLVHIAVGQDHRQVLQRGHPVARSALENIRPCISSTWKCVVVIGAANGFT